MSSKPVSGKWYDIDGYPNYAVTPEGEIARKLKSGKHRIIKPSVKRHKSYVYTYVHLYDSSGKAKEKRVVDIVWGTFRGSKNGCVVYHINGMYSDNDLDNLRLITKTELGKIAGSESERKPVAKISRDGEVLCWYRSARVAAKENHMCYMAVMNRCNEKIKLDEFALDGTTYRWLYEEEKVERLCRELQQAGGA